VLGLFFLFLLYFDDIRYSVTSNVTVTTTYQRRAFEILRY